MRGDNAERAEYLRQRINDRISLAEQYRAAAAQQNALARQAEKAVRLDREELSRLGMAFRL